MIGNGNLVLRFKVGETLQVGRVRVTFLRVTGSRVECLIQGPVSVSVNRARGGLVRSRERGIRKPRVAAWRRLRTSNPLMPRLSLAGV